MAYLHMSVQMKPANFAGTNSVVTFHSEYEMKRFIKTLLYFSNVAIQVEKQRIFTIMKSMKSGDESLGRERSRDFYCLDAK